MTSESFCLPIVLLLKLSSSRYTDVIKTWFDLLRQWITSPTQHYCSVHFNVNTLQHQYMLFLKIIKFKAIGLFEIKRWLWKIEDFVENWWQTYSEIIHEHKTLLRNNRRMPSVIVNHRVQRSFSKVRIHRIPPSFMKYVPYGHYIHHCNFAYFNLFLCINYSLSLVFIRKTFNNIDNENIKSRLVVHFVTHSQR